jgi:hypothetical protein
LHRWLSAKLTGKDPEDVTAEERQMGKVVGLGFPGGLGPQNFCRYAMSSYGIRFTVEQARELKEAWLNAFPEMRRYLEDRRRIGPLHSSVDNPGGWPSHIAAGAALRVFAGTPYRASDHASYPRTFVDWAWSRVSTAEFRDKERFPEDIEQRQGSAALRKALDQEVVVWQSGRVRPFVSYCEARNNVFQGTVADGAKMAIYRLVREGFRVVNFIHDEVIVELHESWDHLALARKIESIMIEEMKRVIPDVAVNVEFALMRKWQKSARPVYDDPNNPTKLLPWEEAGE